MNPDKILIVKNVSREGPGLWELLLKEKGVPYDLADLDGGDAFPAPEKYAALVVLGGPDSANDATGKMSQEISRVREAVEKGVPYLGVCLGLQVLVKACGGEVVRHTLKETGWRGPDDDFFRLELTEAGKRDPLFSGLNASPAVFQLHGETVRLAPSMTLLAQGRSCENQAVRIQGRIAYGLQPHFELTPDLFEKWMDEDDDLKRLDRRKASEDYGSVKEEYEKAGLRIFGNFLEISGLVYL